MSIFKNKRTKFEINFKNTLKDNYEKLDEYVQRLESEVLLINTKNLTQEEKDSLYRDYEYYKDMRVHLGLSIAYMTNFYDPKIISYDEISKKFYKK